MPSEASLPASSPPAPPRLISLDAFRGFVMLLMMAEVIRLAAVSRALPGNAFWAFLAHHQTHVEWIGCSLHDLIQPSFSFIVGVALPFSIAARLARGQTRARMTLHAFSRALILILLGVFLRSVGKPQTYFTFEDTLSQIGLGYGFLFMLGFRPVRAQWITFALLLAGYWLAFALYPLPAPGFDYANVGVPPDWLAQHGLSTLAAHSSASIPSIPSIPHQPTGLAAHWNKNSNPAWAFDTWFLNLFPRETPFVFNVGGYSTLSFIPTLATMLLGLIVGETLRGSRSPSQKLRWLACVGLIGLAAGSLLGALGICPVVKRIWTPSWTLFSGGWCCLLMAAFYFVIDIRHRRAWAFPLIVIGLNSIAAYCMAHLFENFIRSTLLTHFRENTFLILGKPYEPLLLGASTLLILWLMLFWMHRRKIFLRI